MNTRIRIAVWSTALSMLAVWAYFGRQWLDRHAVVYHTEEGWKIASEGLETLWRAWPVLSAGIVLGFLVVLVCLELLSDTLDRAEKHLQADAEKRLDNERQHLHELDQQRNLTLQSRETALAEGWRKLKMQEHQVVEVLSEMSARIKVAEQQASDAEARKQRAYGGFERLRRKQQRERELNPDS